MAGDILAAFVVVFLAELGDKTQLVALTLAGRYRASSVMLALGAAIAVLQTLSVTAGVLISRALPDRAIAVGAGLLFCGFAVWTWQSAERQDRDEEVIGDSSSRRGLVGVAIAFFLAELGDKTMITTAGLAADRGAVPVWIGSFAAMLDGYCACGAGGQGADARITRHRGASARSRWSASPPSQPPRRADAVDVTIWVPARTGDIGVVGSGSLHRCHDIWVRARNR